MEVKKGYKQTDVGVIPDDWEVKKIGEITSISVGRDLKEQNFSSYQDNNFKYPVYSNTVDNTGLYGYYNIPEYQGDSLTVVGRGVGLGTAFRRNGGFGAIGRLLVLFPEKNIDTNYLTEYINHRVRIFEESSGIPQLTGISIAKYKVPLPPTKSEQTAIANAFIDAEELINTLDKLLTKKRNIKQGMMQELLTGKKRLPGFSGKWEVKRLGDVCRITTGKKDVNEGNPDGEFPFFTCSRSHTFSDSFSFDTEAILIAGNGDVGNLHYYKGKFEAYQRTYVLCEFAMNVSYLWHQLEAYLVNSLGIGTIGSSIPYIKMENLVGFQFGQPVDTQEQTAIAHVLSDMDTEISALEQERDKYKAIKQGMMQELLTGRMRLV
jgi:type I restriction enzyme S subunit